MKKVLLTLCGVMAAVVAMAQSDTLVHVRDVYVVKDGGRSEILLGVGGYQVTLTGDKARRQRVKCSFGVSNVELGFSLLTRPGYGGYAASQHNFLDLRVGKSIHFGFRLFDVGIGLNRERTIVLHTGVHLMCDNYVFHNNLTLDRVNSRIEPRTLEGDYKKSKLTTSSLGIPVQVVFTPVKRVTLSVLAYADLLYNTHTKYKKPIHKEHLSGFNGFQGGVGASFAYAGFGVYAKYGLTELFRAGEGPATHPVTVGLYFGF